MVIEGSCVQADACQVVSPQLEHILVVDDDVGQAEVLAYRFRKLGYRLSIASTGRDGLSMARVERPHLIVLDIRLPDSDGLNICLELSEGTQTREIPVIIVSGMEGPDIIRRARAVGCQYYVRKPYDPNALLVLVQTAIAESRDWDR